MTSITTRPDVHCGAPTIDGTRVTLEAVASYLVRGATDAEVLEAFPALDSAAVSLARVVVEVVEQQVRQHVAYRIVAELVCCNAYDGSGVYEHDICYWGGAAASLVRGDAPEDAAERADVTAALMGAQLETIAERESAAYSEESAELAEAAFEAGAETWPTELDTGGFGRQDQK